MWEGRSPVVPNRSVAAGMRCLFAKELSSRPERSNVAPGRRASEGFAGALERAMSRTIQKDN